MPQFGLKIIVEYNLIQIRIKIGFQADASRSLSAWKTINSAILQGSIWEPNWVPTLNWVFSTVNE